MLLFLSLLALTASVSCAPSKRDIDPSLVPPFGWSAGKNPTGTGNCDGAALGADGLPVQVPCSCPPDRALFIQNLNLNVVAGYVVNNTAVEVSFPTDNSNESQLARLTAASVTLQNMLGVGVGCPIESTTFATQQAALLAGQATPSDSPRTPSGSLTKNQVAAIAPPLGWQAGQNPTGAPSSTFLPKGTGDCDGAVNNTNGLPIQVPCSCPPDQNTYIFQLTANANAGRAVNNPSVQFSYPLDDSAGSRLARLNAASITLMNLQGPGIGCPIESTTFAAQQQAILAGSRARAYESVCGLFC
ncbi:hypothetical protein EDB92DRAFT_1801852 [Lactarius akahatsu]|uniref:Uncharacterized protein n=1 Tax=Lactarius akahatsu TaxID=416441 RepID=A0AAD4QB00_9AGAM|nr:hypothetical protein EDB92DRAFT_1801852 [Lactarius akahatsu]